MKVANALKEIRESLMLSKSELSRRSGLSLPTIDRVERGMPCRETTRLKLLQAMGVSQGENPSVFQFRNDLPEQ